MSEADAAPSSSAPAPAPASEEDFIRFMQPETSGWNGELPGEDELLAAGYLVCQQLDDGREEMDVEVIPGALPIVTKKMEKEMEPFEVQEFIRTEREKPLAQNNSKIVSAAVSALCPEHIPS